MVWHLKAHNIPAIVLNNYDGVSTSEVRVGNYKRARGSEFKVVIFLWAKAGTVGSARR